MYQVNQADAVATITDFRTATSQIIDYVADSDSTVLVTRNNEPVIVMLSVDEYERLRGEAHE
jgi:prevent-host-death family protein